jgi:metacaspase-1
LLPLPVLPVLITISRVNIAPFPAGTAIELPFVYRSNEDGQGEQKYIGAAPCLSFYGYFPHIVGLVGNLKQGAKLAAAARSLIQGGLSLKNVDDVKQLIAGAHSFFKRLSHLYKLEGLGEETLVEDWKMEGKDVWIFSGRRTRDVSDVIFHRH